MLTLKPRKNTYSSFWISDTPIDSPLYFAERLHDLRNFVAGVFKVPKCKLSVTYKERGEEGRDFIFEKDPNELTAKSWATVNTQGFDPRKYDMPTYTVKLHGNPTPNMLDLAVGSSIFYGCLGNFKLVYVPVPIISVMKKDEVAKVTGVLGTLEETIQFNSMFIKNIRDHGGLTQNAKDIIDLVLKPTPVKMTLKSDQTTINDVFDSSAAVKRSELCQDLFDIIHMIVSSKLAHMYMENTYKGWHPYFKAYYRRLFMDLLREYTQKPSARELPVHYILAADNDEEFAQEFLQDIIGNTDTAILEKLEKSVQLIKSRSELVGFQMPSLKVNWVLSLSLEVFKIFMDDLDTEDNQTQKAVQSLIEIQHGTDNSLTGMDGKMRGLVDNIPDGSHSIQTSGQDDKPMTTQVIWLPTVDYFRSREVPEPMEKHTIGTHIENGYQFGELLVRKLAFVGEETKMESLYKTRGHMNKRKLHRVGMDLDDFFKETYIEINPNSTIYTSIDMSGSMADGSKWGYAISLMIALGYVGKKIPNIRTLIDLRFDDNRVFSDSGRTFANAVIFDSKESSLEDLEYLLSNISPRGSTPEALLYEFPAQFLEKESGKKYFITLTDGEPTFGLDTYQTERAHELTQRVTQNEGEVLAFYVSTGRNAVPPVFVDMYGNRGSMFSPKQMYKAVEDVMVMVRDSMVDSGW